MMRILNERYSGMRFNADDGGAGMAPETTATDTSVLGGEPLAAAETTDAGDGGSNGKGASNPGWMAGLKKEFQGNEALKGFETVTDLAKHFLEVNEKLSGVVTKPGENATDEERAAYRQAMGIPDEPKSYSIAEVVKGDAVGMATLEAMHKHGIPDAAASEIVKAHSEALAGEISKAHKAASDELRAAWGNEFDVNVSKAQKAVNAIGGDELAKWLRFDSEGMKAGNNVPLVLAFHRIAERLGEDQLEKAGKGGKEVQRLPDGGRMLDFPSMRKK